MYKKNIIWLASYPKSGNTWLRTFLSSLLNEQEVDLANLNTDGIFSGKGIIEHILDIDADVISENQVSIYRKLVFNYLSVKSTKALIYKVHDAFTFFANETVPIIPEESSCMAFYIVRNPMDVSLSLANHIGKSVDVAIDNYVVNENARFNNRKGSAEEQFTQKLGTWSQHVESWMNRPKFPVYFIRYQDMKNAPFYTFKKIVTLANLPYSDTQILQAIENTKFETLQKKEKESGFKENQNLKSSFFYKGEVDRWKKELSTEQINKIKEKNEAMMRHFGYWE